MFLKLDRIENVLKNISENVLKNITRKMFLKVERDV